MKNFLRTHVFVILALIALSTNAEQWLNGKRMLISWHKNVEGAATLDGNVCHVYAPNTPIGLPELGRQVESCFYGEAARGRVSQDASLAPVLVSWQQIREADAPRLYRLIWHNNLATYSNPDSIKGFFRKDKSGSPCFIYADRNHEVLGHEAKHCFDGFYHAPYGYWYDIPANR